MNVSRLPGRGAIFVGIAAAAFATGPCMMALIGIADMLDGFDHADRWMETIGKLPRVVFFSSLICLVGSAPAACVNAYVLNRAARAARDSAWVALFSGAVIGIVVLLILTRFMSGVLPRFQPEFLLFILLFAMTGACMGLLHWVIAIRPRRKMRKRLEYDVDAIQAME